MNDELTKRTVGDPVLEGNVGYVVYAKQGGVLGIGRAWESLREYSQRTIDCILTRRMHLSRCRPMPEAHISSAVATTSSTRPAKVNVSRGEWGKMSIPFGRCILYVRVLAPSSVPESAWKGSEVDRV